MKFNWIDDNKLQPTWIRHLRNDIEASLDVTTDIAYKRGFDAGSGLSAELLQIVFLAKRFTADRNSATLERLIRAVETLEDKQEQPKEDLANVA